ncbi:RBBP9/YdeN family alpha/beta hydrolase [Paenibacillus mendelii]|uniref:RBBP9/YdeN family alpha/beta hydrolase n=1 Tax=Paenibacillus mendelii TaxID=206163 RepID=A0ABV6J9Q1_9BACL|nr:alpha/beta fold hydrolase [Paenibacillus mendelii]MCQ6563767.1 alpha/beta hydrolase [Paenibacillus mendelii]
MKRHILFIQGGGQGAYEADEKLAMHLQDSLGSDYDVLYPRMPDEEKPVYEAWRDVIAEDLAGQDGEVIVVGHSLGASFLLKYLSEEEFTTPIAGVFLIASPYWGAEDWEVGEYMLSEDFAWKLSGIQRIFFYHSRDDVWVPFAHLAMYAEKLPKAVLREFDGRGHQFNNDMTEVAQDIKSL